MYSIEHQIPTYSSFNGKDANENGQCTLIRTKLQETTYPRRLILSKMNKFVA